MSTHLTLAVDTVEGVTVRSTLDVINELIAFDTSTADTQSAFDYTMTSEQIDEHDGVIDEMERRGMKRTADGSFRAEDRKLWGNTGRKLLTTLDKWSAVKKDKKDSLGLEDVMDALHANGFELVSSHSMLNVNYSNQTTSFVARRDCRHDDFEPCSPLRAKDCRR